mmetsp:Transcript_15/g.35  ORF Transcript_15/g.35 Transcript_15/m.35 type:complete len:101 (+) Transcript_15:90-392(+)
MFQVLLPCILNASAGLVGDQFETYSSSYYSKRWINSHLLEQCHAGLGSSGEVKKCIEVGKAQTPAKMRKYVHQISKGCFPGVIHTASGGRCELPGWDNDW